MQSLQQLRHAEGRFFAGPYSLYAADCLAVLFLGGSGLSLRDSGFALWPVYFRKTSPASRGSQGVCRSATTYLHFA